MRLVRTRFSVGPGHGIDQVSQILRIQTGRRGWRQPSLMLARDAVQVIGKREQAMHGPQDLVPNTEDRDHTNHYWHCEKHDNFLIG